MGLIRRGSIGGLWGGFGGGEGGGGGDVFGVGVGMWHVGCVGCYGRAVRGAACALSGEPAVLMRRVMRAGKAHCDGDDRDDDGDTGGCLRR